MTCCPPNACAVVMAGGRGERFWPLSRTARPKQLLDLFGGRTLVRQAVDRLEGLVPPERVWIITARDLLDATRAAVPGVPAAQVVGEPCGRDTAAACALGTELAGAWGGEEVPVVILTADHLMGDLDGFRRTLADVLGHVASRPVLATIGIPPTSPSTGFGYIEAGDRLDVAGPTAFHEVRRFVEKPDRATAEAYLAGGRHLWNSGMFAWTVRTFREALRQHRPALAEAMAAVGPAVRADTLDATLESLYAGLERISIDYAVMEHARNLVMARGTFGWDDVGSWTAVAERFDADGEGNVAVGPAELLDARRNLVVTESGHLVALLGVEDLVVVHTPDATMVCPASRVQDIKALVRKVSERTDGTAFL